MECLWPNIDKKAPVAISVGAAKKAGVTPGWYCHKPGGKASNNRPSDVHRRGREK